MVCLSLEFRYFPLAFVCLFLILTPFGFCSCIAHIASENARQQDNQDSKHRCSTTIHTQSYPNGAVLVSCATCETVSNVAPSSNLAIQIPCVSCKHLLQFPLSTSLAQCPLCKVVFCIKTRMDNPFFQASYTHTTPPFPQTCNKTDLRHLRHSPPPSPRLGPPRRPHEQASC